jgi:hypothetical protein
MLATVLSVMSWQAEKMGVGWFPKAVVGVEYSFVVHHKTTDHYNVHIFFNFKYGTQ